MTVAPTAREYGDYIVNGALQKVYIATESGFEAYDTETGERLETELPDRRRSPQPGP